MLQRSTLLLLFLFALLSASAPLRPRTEPEPEPETSSWRAQPRGRGTFQIIVSCAVTLGLCVWTAIRPNVKGEKAATPHMIYKLKMAVKALLMPEIIVSTAWDEWKQARALHRALIYANRQADREAVERKWWDRVKYIFVELLVAMGAWIDENGFPKQVAFFVVMGGYVKSDDTPVTASEFFHAFKEGKIDTTTRIAAIKAETGPVNTIDGNPTKPVIGIKINDVLDKGKTSVLAKLIICGQFGWMILQLIGREVTRLPMTLIELHTLIHILIAVTIFRLWWHKPLDVFEPIVLDLEFPEKKDPAWSERPQELQSTGIRRLIDYFWLLPLPKTGRDDALQSKQTPNADNSDPGAPRERDVRIDSSTEFVLCFK